eukprot:c15204_g1_i3.p1 GENE.c15204_g1_i3~~c15204_g1_i3.p1  ORF type:complete len:613 (+),score=112.95 c15204_g1_i3:208-1839(+)
MVAATGYMAALHKMGFLDKIRYMTGVSGSSWLVAAYVYRQNQTSDNDFFPEINEPETLSLDYLFTPPPPSVATWIVPEIKRVIAQNIQAQTLENIWIQNATALAEFLHDRRKDSHLLWQTAIGSVYFAHHGIQYSDMFSWDESDVTDIKQRNPSLQNTKFITRHPGSPFPILTGMAMGPLPMAPLVPNAVHNAFTNFEMTPLYIGAPFSRDVTYVNNTHNETVFSGGLLEPFGFGAPAPLQRLTTETGLLTLNPPEHPFSVQDISGIASMALSSTFATLPENASSSAIPKNLPVWEFVPKAPTFPNKPPPTAVGETGSVEMMYGDGGLLEITGVISLLLRRVTHVVVFDMSTKPVDKTNTLGCLFAVPGIEYFGDSFDYRHNHVFEQSGYQPLVERLQARIDAGEAGIVTATLRTVDNDWWGLKGGSIVQFTWVALHAPDNWQNRLPEHVKQAMALTNTFEKFPWYDTITQFLLTTPQTNLLTSMTGHALLSNSDLIRSGLNIPFPSSTATSTPTSSVSSTLSPTASPSTSPSPSVQTPHQPK